MTDLFEPAGSSGVPADNAPALSVGDLANALKRVIEGAFGRVRVRGEIGRISRPGSGHLYFTLKDDRASIDAVIWRGQATRLSVRPEEGMEVIATGRMTTFAGASKYQLVIDDIAPAGIGALMAMLERRRVALAAEGLFDAARKRPLPYLPRVIGVITSPSGAVIRDILHRLRDRFPVRVLIWPVAVQGERCAPDVAAAIRGFNALAADGPVPRPDLLIVARGGGSLEDLWGFNEEAVVRAAAASNIALISAVGHETDTTLIDHASDRRAPTPTAAAEMAVPVRADLIGQIDGLGVRLGQATLSGLGARRQRALDLGRALPRPETLLEAASQRLDSWTERLPRALAGLTGIKRGRLAGLGLRSGALTALVAQAQGRVDDRAARLTPAMARLLQTRQERLDAMDRLRQTLGHAQTLRRGFAVVRGHLGLVTSRQAAAREEWLEIQFHDGRIGALTQDAPPKSSP